MVGGDRLPLYADCGLNAKPLVCASARVCVCVCVHPSVCMRRVCLSAPASCLDRGGRAGVRRAVSWCPCPVPCRSYTAGRCCPSHSIPRTAPVERGGRTHGRTQGGSGGHHSTRRQKDTLMPISQYTSYCSCREGRTDTRTDTRTDIRTDTRTDTGRVRRTSQHPETEGHTN